MRFLVTLRPSPVPSVKRRAPVRLTTHHSPVLEPDSQNTTGSCHQAAVPSDRAARSRRVETGAPARQPRPPPDWAIANAWLARTKRAIFGRQLRDKGWVLGDLAMERLTRWEVVRGLDGSATCSHGGGIAE